MPTAHADAPGVDHIGGRNGNEEVDQHEDQREQIDLQGADLIESNRLAGDGCKGDPLHLHQGIDEEKEEQNYPTIPVNLDAALICHRQMRLRHVTTSRFSVIKGRV